MSRVPVDARPAPRLVLDRKNERALVSLAVPVGGAKTHPDLTVLVRALPLHAKAGALRRDLPWRAWSPSSD